MENLEQRAEIGLPPSATEQQLQRVRTQAACFMIIAGLAVGFIAGRASVWFAPFDSGRQNLAATKHGVGVSSTGPQAIRSGSRALSPAPATTGPDKADSKPGEQPAAKIEAKAATSGAATPGDVPAAAAPASVNGEPAKTGDPAAAPAEKRATPDSNPLPPSPPAVPRDAGAVPPANRFTLINPGTANAGPVAQLPAAADIRPDQTAAGVAECERRYSSFQRSDGTYQPLYGGPRRRCPHLR